SPRSLKQYSLYVVDLDGVLYRGDAPIAGAADALSRLRSRGALIRFLTNNSTQTRVEFAAKLGAMGFAAEEPEIYTSAAGAARLFGGQSVYVLGEEGLRKELAGGGCKVVVAGDADWVVVGACWSFTYAMLDEAQLRIRSGARYLATNPDKTFPVEGGRLRPGAGAIVAAVSAACGKEPEIMVGKPEPTLVNLILEETDVPKTE